MDRSKACRRWAACQSFRPAGSSPAPSSALPVLQCVAMSSGVLNCVAAMSHSHMEVTQMKCVTVNVCTCEGVSMCANWCFKNA